MKLNNIDLNLLLIFEAVWLERNLTQAGKRIGLTQPAVSNALGRLRLVLEDDLFIRISKKMQPTAKAERIAPSILDALEKIRSSLDEKTGFDPLTDQRKFFLDMTDYSQLIFFPNLLRTMSKEAPEMELSINPVAHFFRVESLKRGHVDLAIRGEGYFEEGEAGVHQVPLYRETQTCVVRKDHPVIQGEITLEQYLHFPHISFIPVHGEQWATQLKQRIFKGYEGKIVGYTGSFSVIPSVLMETDFISVLPRRLAHIFAKNDSLQLLEPPLDLGSFQLMLYWHESTHNSPEHQWLRTMVLKLCEGITAFS